MPRDDLLNMTVVVVAIGTVAKLGLVRRRAKRGRECPNVVGTS